MGRRSPVPSGRGFLYPGPWACAVLLTLRSTSAGLAQATPGFPPPAVAPQAIGAAHPFEAHDLSESSGLVASHRHPGLFWTLNDSGNAPDLFATDSLGRALGRVHVAGARNVDWEDLSLGPCGARQCLYIADTGDNRERRASVSLYRVPEPDLPSWGPGTVATASGQELPFGYPDGPRDLEAMAVDSLGDAWLVSKGRSGGVHLYRLPHQAWDESRPVTALMVQALPLPTSPGTLDLVTGAALSPSGDRLLLRTYLDAYVMPRRQDGTVDVARAERCDLRPLFGDQEQGEGVTWLEDGRFGVSSESRDGHPASIRLFRCLAGRIR